MTIRSVEVRPIGEEHGLWVDGAPLPHAELPAALRTSARVRAALTEALVASPHHGVFFECAPFHPRALDRPVRFVIRPSAAVGALRPDPGAFWGPFQEPRPVCTFPNLGGDALLVAPRPVPGLSGFPHLLAFLRTAPEDLAHRFWTAVGAATARRLVNRQEPLWLSTSGLGVPWLHLRLDDRPKYITWRPYRHAPLP